MPNSTLTRAAAFAPKSYDDKAHTIEVEVSTENPVQGVILSHARAAVDLSRFIGAPFLNSHKRGDARDVLGVVTAARIENRKLIASVKLTRREDAAGIIQDILDGITPQTSAGFTVSQWGTEAVDSKTGARTRTATRWRPFEVSVVPYAADETRVRSEPANPGANSRNSSMPKKLGAKPAPSDADVIDTPADENTATQTRAEIRKIIKRAGGTPEQADELIDADATEDEVRAAADEIMQARTNAIPRIRVGVSHEDPTAILERQIGGLYARASGTKPEDSSREFVGLQISDHASLILQRAGVRTFGMSREQILTRALGTSDLPNLLQGVGNRSLLAKYAIAQSPLVSLAKKSTLPDFRPAHRLRAGEFGALLPLGEHGEIQHAAREESKQSIQVEPFARRIDYSMKAALNDDLSALTDASEQFGIAAAARDAEELISVINANPQMDDGFNLFSADHNNTRPWSFLGDDLAVGDMSEIRQAMRGITGLDGTTLLNIAPKYLVVSKEIETSAEKFLATYQAAHFGETNPFQSKLTLMVEPRLPAYSWYVFADPALAPVFELAHLAGREGPQIETQQAWDTWGVSFRCIHVVGAAAIGWRGAYRVENGDANDSNSSGN